MRKVSKKLKILGLLIMLAFCTAGAVSNYAVQEVQAATPGFVKSNGKTYYIKANGKKHTGWLTLNKKTYYFSKGSGVMATGWKKNSKGQRRFFGTDGVMYKNRYGVINNKRYYFTSNGIMATGWMKDGKGNRYYFGSNGVQKMGTFAKIGKYTYYFSKGTGIMATGWRKNSQGKQRYFNEAGVMYQNRYATIGGKTYYFDKNGFVSDTFRTVDQNTYYILKNGTKKKGWLELNGKKYYFDPTTGVMQKGFKNIDGKKYYFAKSTGVMATKWVKNSKGQKRYFGTDGVMRKNCFETVNGKKYYFNSNGIMATGWMKDSRGRRYYFASNGAMTSGFTDIGSNRYYFAKSTGIMATGWVKNSSGGRRYFGTDGIMRRNALVTIDGNTYSFKKNGIARTGWVTYSNGKKRYFDPETCIMVKSTVEQVGEEYYNFDSNGYMTGQVTPDPEITAPTSERTIKNYLLGALQPVGQALYVWGGGWNDSRRKGVSPAWKKWYDSQSSDYNYRDSNYADLSTASRAKGLDCSGFVGWAAYQVMQTTSGVGSGYTVVAADVGSSYKARGWGSLLTQSKLSANDYVLKAGDVGYNAGHTWIVIGQCKDKSAVIVHSTPNAGCQISGTPTPSGGYISQAITLAKKYMSKYGGFEKYDYHTSSGNYIKQGNYLRWNKQTLADPDGYLNMTADQILADLFKNN